MLGAGYTHREGEYQDTIKRALEHLRGKVTSISHGADLRDGSMYGQALATIALCEAYGMTKDEGLKDLRRNDCRLSLRKSSTTFAERL